MAWGYIGLREIGYYKIVFFRQSTPEFQRDFLQKLAGEYGNATDYLLATVVVKHMQSIFNADCTFTSILHIQ